MIVDGCRRHAALRPEKPRLLTRDEFAELCAAGVFDDEHVELLRGVLVTMGEQSEPHARVSAWFHARLVFALDFARFEIRSHTSYAATHDSVPEPDVQVVERSLRRRLPRRAQLLIEVSESSLTKDRTIKAPIYGEGRAPEYWVVDLRAELVWVHTRPTPTGYRSVVSRKRGDVLRPIALPGIAIAVAEIPWQPRDVGGRRRRGAKK